MQQPLIEKSLSKCKYKERSQSVHNNSRPKQYGKYGRDANRPSLLQRPQTHAQLAAEVVATVTEGAEKGGFVSLGARPGKVVKRESVNYRKFDVMFADGQWEAGVVELEEVLGCGASATVRLGRDRRTAREFAVKVYEKYKLVEASRKKRVLQEIDILSRLEHPNIIALAHCCQDKRQVLLCLRRSTSCSNSCPRQKLCRILFGGAPMTYRGQLGGRWRSR